MNTKTPALNPTRQAQVDAEKAAKAAAAKAEAKQAKIAKVDATLTKKITLLVDKNPKRDGSDSAKRFSAYKTGQTVEAYITHCVETLKQSRRAARADITWDVDHKFIELSA